jgi:hypothetical protein
MKKFINYVIAYIMWIVDIGLALLLFILSRNALLRFLGLFYKQGSPQYNYSVSFIDKIFSIALGLVWLAFVIFTEQYFRKGVTKETLFRQITRVTGSLLLGIFVVNLILQWLPGVSSNYWMNWFILATELVIGRTLVVFSKKKSSQKSI